MKPLETQTIRMHPNNSINYNFWAFNVYLANIDPTQVGVYSKEQVDNRNLFPATANGGAALPGVGVVTIAQGGDCDHGSLVWPGDVLQATCLATTGVPTDRK